MIRSKPYNTIQWGSGDSAPAMHIGDAGLGTLIYGRITRCFAQDHALGDLREGGIHYRRDPGSQAMKVNPAGL